MMRMILVVLLALLGACSSSTPSTPAAQTFEVSTFAADMIPEKFVVHPAVSAWVEAGGEVAADKPFRFGKARPFGTKRLEFQASRFTRTGTALVWCGVSLRSGSSVADVWFQISYGGRPVSVPMALRETVTAAFWSGGKPSGSVELDRAGSHVLNGQSAPPRYVTYDFATHTMAVPAQVAAFSTSKRVPHDASQTGGKWDYMGMDTIGAMNLEEARRQFYPIAGYGGVFYKPTGAMVTEQDWPKAVLQNGYHFHRDTPTWIRYSDPRNPWKNKATMRAADGQHFCVYNGPALAAARWPWDLGLRRLHRANAARYLWQIPGTDKGTYAWDPSQARERGRIISYAVYATEAFEASGEADTWLAKAVAKRAATRLTNQIAETAALLRGGDRMPWPNFERSDEPKRPDKISPAEMGIWFWGLHEASGFYQRIGEPVPPALAMLKVMVAEFVFDCYFVQDGAVELPYYVTEKWDHPRKRSGGRHFGWLAAHHASPRTKADKAKAALLASYGTGLDPRWKAR